jgi:DNA-binding transcriptional regulator LsrR (DeoR family)
MMTEKPAKEMDSSRQQLLGRVAWLYYQEEHTQAEIAEKLGLSRVTVNRLLKAARESGIVEIKVHSAQSREYELAGKLCEQFGLRDAVVVPAIENEQALLPVLAQAAAGVLAQRLHPGMVVGVGVGRTVSLIPEYLHLDEPLACRFIGLTGGLDLPANGIPHNFETLSRLANAFGGEVTYIPAPSYVTQASVQQAFLSEGAVIQALQAASRCDLAIFSVGAAGFTALLYQFGQITAQDLQELHQRQAAGDVLGRFFDQDGQELQIGLNQRMIGLSLEQLKQIPLKILAAGGTSKHQAIKVAAAHQLCDILVTDTSSAAWLLS